MLQISEIVRKTEEMFDLFNEHFYEGELNHPAITVSPDGGRGAYGWCSINEIWNASGEKYREINLCAEYLDRPIFGGCKIFCVYGNETFQIRIRYVVVFVGFCSRIFCRIYLSGYSISCPLSFIHAF